MTPPSDAASTRDLLSIDVAAELRKVSGLALEGPWQVPSVLLRWAVMRGARRADVTLRRRAWRVSTDAPLAPDDATSIATILDASRSDADRHAAFVALERGTARDLACLASCGRGRLSVAHGRSFSWRLGSPLRDEPRSTGVVGTTFELRGASSRRARAAQRLAEVVRFADIEVTLDGAGVARGFQSSLGSRTLAPPLQGRASLTAGTDGARVWLLGRGAAIAHLTLPEAPASEVALELSGTGCEATPAAFREAAAPLADRLVEQIVELLVASARRFESLSYDKQAALRRQLLRAGVFRRAHRQIVELRLIPALQGPARALRLVSLAELQAAAQETGSIGFIAPGDPAVGVVAGSAPLVVLDTVERARLARRTGLKLTPPPRQAPLGRFELLKRRLRRSWRRVAGAWASVAARDSTPPHRRTGARRLEDALLGSSVCFGDARVTAVRFVRGRGAASMSRGRLTLPTGNPLVSQSLLLLERDDRYLAAAVLALGRGDLFPMPARTGSSIRD